MDRSPASDSSFLGALARSLASGMGLYASYSVVAAAVSGRLVRKPSEVAKTITSASCLKFGAFLGGFTAIYRLITKYLRHWRQREDGLNALIASAVAGIVIKLQPRERRTILLLFISTRGVGAFLNTLHSHGILPSSPVARVIIFSVSVGIVMQSAVLFPDQLPPSYYRSLVRWSGRITDSHLAQLFRPLSGDVITRPTCRELYHPHCSCWEFAGFFFLESWGRSAKLYTILYSLSLLIFRPATLLKSPLQVVASTATQGLRSGAFLGLSVSISVSSFCWLSNHMQKQAREEPEGDQPCPAQLHPFIPFAIGFAAGLPILIERPSRHFELVLYVIPMVLHTIAKALQKKGILPPMRHASVAVFGACMMAIMHAYEFQRDSLPPFLYRFISFLIK